CRNSNKPSAWSISGFVRKTPAIGLLRGASPLGCNCGVISICRGKSGDALIKNQLRKLSGSPLTAMLDRVCGAILPERAATQFAQAQFHCGRPPPAALPRIRMRINSRKLSQLVNQARSNRARVTRALEEDRHG